MNGKMAFRAAYADWKLIKTRGVVSISFEVPLNESHLAYEALGGMPVAAKEIWCAVARLHARPQDGSANLAGGIAPNVGGDHEVIKKATRQAVSVKGASSDEPEPGCSRPREKTAWRDMRLANQAGMLCAEVPFQRFLSERLKYEKPFTADEAAHHIRRHCNVASRSDIRADSTSGKRWERLVAEYRAWMHAPEFADA